MTDLVKSLLSQMSSKFNETTSSELAKNLDYQEDKTLKWKTLINNTYAKKDREKKNKNRNKDGEDSGVEEKQPSTSSPTPSSSHDNSSDPVESMPKQQQLDEDESSHAASSSSSTPKEEKSSSLLGAAVNSTTTTMKKIVIEVDDNLHSSSTHTRAAAVVDDDEKNISTNLPQLNTNSQAIESTKTKVTSTTTIVTSPQPATDKPTLVDDDSGMSNTKTSSLESCVSGTAEDDKRAKSSTAKLPTTPSPRTLRSNKIIAAASHKSTSNSDLVSETDESNDVEPAQPKKGRGRPKLEVKMALQAATQSSNDSTTPPATRQSRQKSEAPKTRSSTQDSQDEKVKLESEENSLSEVKTEVDESPNQPKRRGRSRKVVDERDEKETDVVEQHTSATSTAGCNDDELTDASKANKNTNNNKRAGKLSKKAPTTTEDESVDLNADNKSETNASDDFKPRLLMTINLTDKSAVISSSTPTPTGVSAPVQLTVPEEAQQQEKIVKKRGRRPKATSISKPIQVKKSERLAKDGSSVGGGGLSQAVKKPDPALLQPPIGRIRSQRRIKPTAKILANEELRQGFEATICKRLSLSNENLMDSYERRSFSGNEKSSPAVSSPEKSPKNVESSPEIIVEKANEILIKNLLQQAKKPCRDPQEFIAEIKNSKFTQNRVPEEAKKLTKKQQRKLLKQKEKHLGLLGLRPKNGRSDTSNDSSASEDYDPKRLNKPRPPITLRLRKRTDFLKRHHSGYHKKIQDKRMRYEDSQQIEIEMSDEDDCVVVENSNKENSSINYVCSCSEKTRYCINNAPNNQFAINGKMFCSAIDEIETRKIGCTNELTDSIIQLYRPSQKVSYMALCTNHRKRLVSHNCCSGCGIFCTQGTFVICSNRHFFHRNCATKYILNAPYELLLKCPHCGIDAPTFDFRVTMRCENLPVFVQQRSSTVPKPAKMGNTLRHAHQQHPIQISSLTLNIEKLIPEAVQQIVKIAGDRIRSQNPANYDLSKLYAPKDIFNLIHRKDGDERMAEIVASGFNLMTPLRDFHNGTCLHLIANFGSLTMAYLILSRANSHDFVNLMDKELRTPIMYSVAGKKNDILKLLCQCGADVTLKGPDGMTVLHLAAKSGNIQATQIVLESYRQTATTAKLLKFINTTDDGQWSAMVWAAENGHGDIVSYLISLGADPNICDSENNTVLHWACLAGKIESIFPLAGNTDANIQNLLGDTALHIAARHSKTKICMILMGHGADLSIKNAAGETPLDCADEKTECGKLLRFNVELRQIGIGGWRSNFGNRLVLCNDISNGREVYPIQIVKNLNAPSSEETILPDFKYITKNILLQNSIQIDQRISQMRVCSCSDNCISDNCQCAQISLQNWYNIDGRLISTFNYADPPMLFECNDVCQCNKLLCKNRVVQNGIKLPLVVFEADDKGKGFGVKCLTRIRKGTFVAQYVGEILTDEEADRRTNDSFFFDLGASDHCLDANFYGNVSRFFNHSCSANIIPVRVYFDHQDLRFPKIAFFASRDIEAGEEIAFDYGEKFWMIKYRYLTCLCKSDNCHYSEETFDRTVAEYNQRNNNRVIEQN